MTPLRCDRCRITYDPLYLVVPPPGGQTVCPTCGAGLTETTTTTTTTGDDAVLRALQVLVQTRHVYDYLRAHDPKALAQAEAALAAIEPEAYAVCCSCGQLGAVCCDDGYREDGTHDDPRCRGCCHGRGNQQRFAVEQPAQAASYTCPDWPNADPTVPHGDGMGCGHRFDATPDAEGLVDCPACGLWFNPAKEQR